ncbi:MAG TPA: hypothetical protein VFA10_17905 [Ktedonobacteraceae bacterium]|nr:hypothetical protein [Ktedonobacteraceae bacterium]
MSESICPICQKPFASEEIEEEFKAGVPYGTIKRDAIFGVSHPAVCLGHRERPNREARRKKGWMKWA